MTLEKHCFVIMPFSTTTDDHTDEYWNNFFSDFIKPNVEELGYTYTRSEAAPDNIIYSIINNLILADLVLAVLTDFNPNVWYELGVRHARKKGTIMIMEKDKKLPFDISQYGVISYPSQYWMTPQRSQEDRRRITDFKEELSKFIHKIESDKSPDNPVLASLTRPDYLLEFLKREKIEDFNMERKRGNHETLDFNYSDLQNKNLADANLSRTTFRVAHLEGANFEGANLRRADFHGAYLNHTKLIRTNLCKSNMSDANLSYADLTRANLSYADLTSANTDNTVFVDTDLSHTIKLPFSRDEALNRGALFHE